MWIRCEKMTPPSVIGQCQPVRDAPLARSNIQHHSYPQKIFVTHHPLLIFYLKLYRFNDDQHWAVGCRTRKSKLRGFWKGWWGTVVTVLARMIGCNWAEVDCSGLYCNGMCWAATGLYWTVRTGMFWAVLGSNELYWALLCRLSVWMICIQKMNSFIV